MTDEELKALVASNAKVIEALISEQGDIRAALKEQGERTDRQLLELIRLLGSQATEANQDRARLFETVARNSESQAQIHQSLQDIATEIAKLAENQKS